MAEKRITMSDIADKLGLSINAVSLALNGKAGVSEETRKNIENGGRNWISGPEREIYIYIF